MMAKNPANIRRSNTIPEKRIDKFRFFFDQARRTSEIWRIDAKEDYSFVEGYGQWNTQQREELLRQNRPALVMNSILPTINLISGQERASRLGTTYKPRGFDDDRFSQMANMAYRYASDASELPFNVSDAFNDMVICGRGWLGVFMDFMREDEPLGELKIQRIHPLTMFWDDNAQRYDKQDANYLIWAKWISEDILRIYYPSAMEDVHHGEWLNMPADLIGEDTLDKNWRDKRMGKVRLLEFWYKVPKSVAFMITPSGVQRFESQRAAKEARDLMTLMATRQFAQVPDMDILERVIRDTRVAHVTYWRILRDMPSPYGHNLYPFIPLTAYAFDEKVMGVVRSLKDPQREKNKRWSQMLHMINTMAKGGWKIPKRSVSQEVLNKWSTEAGKPGFWFEYNPIAGEPKEIAGQNIPTSFVSLMQLAEDEVRKTSGAIQELLGLARAGDQSGRAIQTLQASGATILAPLFDSHVRSQKLTGHQVIELIGQYYPPEKLIDILGIAGINQLKISEEEIFEFAERALKAKYNTVVDVTPLLGSDRERQFNQALSLMEVLAKSGMPPPPQLIGLMVAVSDWPGKEELLAQIQQGGQEANQGAIGNAAQ